MNIIENLNKIKKSVFGKDVRDAIHDSIKQCYDDAIANGHTDMEVVQARGSYSNLNDRLNSTDSSIRGLAGGSPLVASSASEMIDTTRIYVNTSNGHWYYYNGSNWADGGVYQATEIEDNSVTLNKLATQDEETSYEKFEYLVRNTDGQGRYTTNKIYRPGFVKSIQTYVNGTSEQNAKIYILRKITNAQYKYEDVSYQVTGVGPVTVDVNKYFDYEFIVAVQVQNLAYNKDISDFKYHGASLPTSAGDGIYNIDFNGQFKNYCFSIKVVYDGPQKILDDLQKKENTIEVDINLKKGKIISSTDDADFPITFDFEKRVVKINCYIVRDFYEEYNKYVRPLKLDLSVSIPERINTDGYFIFVLYDFVDKIVSIYRSNSDSYSTETSKEVFANKLCLGYIFTNEDNDIRLGDINRDLINVLTYKKLNTDENISDDRYIPKFAERRYHNQKVVNNSQWIGKTLNCLGDSITKGENSADNYLRMKDDNIASVLRELLGFSVSRNYGIGGSRIVTHSDSTFAKKGMADRYMDMQQADVITVWGGTNDFGNHVEMGDLSDLSSNTKFKPAFYNLLNGLLTNYSNAKILVITPIHRAGTKPENVANGQGLYLKDYRDAEIEICEKLGVPYLDLWTELGFTPFNTTMCNKYTPDGLHPNINCMRNIIAPKIATKLNTL